MPQTQPKLAQHATLLELLAQLAHQDVYQTWEHAPQQLHSIAELAQSQQFAQSAQQTMFGLMMVHAFLTVQQQSQ